MLKLPTFLKKTFNSVKAMYQRQYSTCTSDHFHHFMSAHNGKSSANVDEFLNHKAVHINISKYINSKDLSPLCPINKLHGIQLAANNPLEDRWNVGFTQVEDEISSFLFSVLDGHSGSACSHALAWIALEYIAVSFLSDERLKTVLHNMPLSPRDSVPYHIARRLEIVDRHNHTLNIPQPPPPDVKALFHLRLRNYIQELLNRRQRDTDPQACFTESLNRLDEEICALGMDDLETFSNSTNNPFNDDLSHDILQMATSGSVGVFGHLSWQNASSFGTPNVGELRTKAEVLKPVNSSALGELRIANVGDCAAVLVSEAPNGGLESHMLTVAHQGGSNPEEVLRLMALHPEDTRKRLLRNGGRLLGELAPSRAFGDVRYKWPAKRLYQLAKYFGAECSTDNNLPVPLGPWAGLPALPTPYSSPPYLIAKPDVTVVQIRPCDRYLIVATDGLWDEVTPERATEVLESLADSQCPATQLVRAALTRLPPKATGHRSSATLPGSQFSPAVLEAEGLRLAGALLSLPPGLARYYRDDITVVVLELGMATNTDSSG